MFGVWCTTAARDHFTTTTHLLAPQGNYEEASKAILSGSKWDKKGDAFDILRGEVCKHSQLNSEIIINQIFFAPQIAFHHFFQKAKKAIKAKNFKLAVATIREGQKIDFQNEKLKEILPEVSIG